MRGPRRESRVRVWWGMERLGERPSRSLSSPATFFFPQSARARRGGRETRPVVRGAGRRWTLGVSWKRRVGTGALCLVRV
jgi:hypothetical protein